MTQDNSQITAERSCEERPDDANALFILGTRYSTGRDVELDLVAAHKWFNLAAMMGHEAARLSRTELGPEMSAAQIAEAQRQAREWLWGRANAMKQGEPAKAAPPLVTKVASTPERRPALPAPSALCA